MAKIGPFSPSGVEGPLDYSLLSQASARGDRWLGLRSPISANPPSGVEGPSTPLGVTGGWRSVSLFPPTTSSLIGAKVLALSTVLLAASAAGAPVLVPTLERAPAIDGAIGALSNGAMVKSAVPALVRGRAATFQDTLYLEVEASAPLPPGAEGIIISLFFPSAGATAQGYLYRLGTSGPLPPRSDAGPPAALQTSIQSRGGSDSGRWKLEAAIALRAFPRFPARGPMEAELCLGLDGMPADELNSACGESRARMSTALRKALTLPAQERLVGLEGRPEGWVGYGALHTPTWLLGNESLTEGAVVRLAATRPVDPRSVHIPIPDSMELKGRGQLFAVITGEDPYAREETCNREAELRMSLYLAKGKEARRVLEWPVANCALGRAASIVLDDEEDLRIGYSYGSSSTFIWGGERFERTELGKR